MVTITLSAPNKQKVGSYFNVSGTVFNGGDPTPDGDGPAPNGNGPIPDGDGPIPLGLVYLGPVSGAQVSIYRNGTQFGSDTTDGAGFYSDTVRINTPGDYQIRAKALGQWSNSVWITIYEEEPTHGTNLTIYVPTSVYEGVAFNVWGRLYDAETGGFLSGRTIKFKVDGVLVATASTDSEGVYSFDVTIYVLGDHMLKVSYGGTSASLRLGVG